MINVSPATETATFAVYDQDGNDAVLAEFRATYNDARRTAARIALERGEPVWLSTEDPNDTGEAELIEVRA